MLSFPLAFVLFVVPKFMFFKLHLFNLCFKFHGSFWSFSNFEFFSTVKLLGEFQKNKNKNFQVKSHREAPGANQGGPPLAQEARWRGPAPGHATQAPGAHRDPWLLPLLPLSLSLFLLKSLCSCSGFAVLAVLEHRTSISLYSH